MLLVDSHRRATLSYQYVCSLSKELISPIVRQGGYFNQKAEVWRLFSLVIYCSSPRHRRVLQVLGRVRNCVSAERE